jgi:excisionase family DNA binding protein
MSTSRAVEIAKVASVTRPLMTADQVAELLAVPKARVWSMSRRGEIPTVRIGPRDVRYRAEDVDAWIARRTTSRPRGTRS